MHKLSLAYFLATLLLYGCGGGGVSSGICEPPFDLSGRWQGTLKSSVDGRSRSVSAILDQGKVGTLSGSIVSPPCWPLSDDLSGGARGEEACKFDNSVYLSSGLFSGPIDNFDSFIINGEQSNSRTITGRYTMDSKVSGCPKSDRGVVTINKAG